MPIIIYAITAFLIFAELISKKKLNRRIIMLIVLLLLGVSYLQQVMVRADEGHLAVASPPFIILFGILLSYNPGNKRAFLKGFKIFAVLLTSFLMVLFVFKNTENVFKHIYKRAYIRKTIEPVAFKQGTAYIPDDVRDEFISLVEYIENNTEKTEKIYIGNLNHSVPQFGWYELIYFLTERLPAVKYYEIHPGLQDKENIQEEMILSLRKNNTKILFLRDFKSDRAPLGPLDRYIREEYKLGKIIDSYHIYVKK